MDIIISHKTALEYWRLYGNMKIDGSVRQRRKNLPASLPGIADIRNTMPSGLVFSVNLMIKKRLDLASSGLLLEGTQSHS